jgi:TP53 regulating kinase-like protein
MVEDKAVDLYVLEKAFLATHPNSEKMWSRVLESYHGVHNGNSKVLQKLHDVRKRGRKRAAFG